MFLLLLFISLASSAAPGRVQLQVDTSEAEHVLAILGHDQPVPEAEWQKLFATEPYQRLKKREAGMHRDFTDEDFKKFVLSEDLRRKAADLAATLDRWKHADLNAHAERVLEYLPERAVIHARVYPVIKPQTNSFVIDVSTDPAIFLYIDPTVTADEFSNTVSHELHHIGLGSLGDANDKEVATLPENVRPAADWIGAFGEGMAMLAAAGGPGVHPHATSKPADRARWDHDMANFNDDLRTVNQFFLDIVSGKFANPDAIRAKAAEFFGVQGPWYTVGYRMSVMVEKRFGRAALIQTMLDPRCLLALYNKAAAETPGLPLWSEALLTQVGASSCGVAKQAEQR